MEEDTQANSKMPLRKFTVKSLGVNKGHKLKAKAGQARRLVQFTAQLAEEFQGHDGDFHRHQAMATLKSLFELAGQAELTKEDMAQWRLNAAYHMYYYAHCGFPVYPKFHYFMHMPEQVERGGVPKTGCTQMSLKIERSSRSGTLFPKAGLQHSK